MCRNDASAKFRKRKVFVISREQCRAGRALLDWTQKDLADRAAISSVSIRAFEKGGEMRESNRRTIREALEAAGVVFLADGELAAGGPGVRLKATVDDGKRPAELNASNDD
jgi:DNA-binding XRE family transcriptional regulator